MEPKTTGQLLDESTKVAQSAANLIGSSFTQGVGATPLSSKDLTSTPSLSIPTPTGTGASSDLSSLIATNTAQTKADVLAEQTRIAQEQAQAKADTSQKGLMDAFLEKINVQRSKGAVQEEFGIAGKTQKVTDLTNQMEALEKSQLDEIRALDQMPGTLEQKQQRITDINYKFNQRKADVAILQSAANRDLQTASILAENKINAQLEPIDTKIQFLKLFYDDNKDILSKAEQNQFNVALQDAQAERQQRATELKVLSDTKLDALRNIYDNAPPEVANQLARAVQLADSPEKVLAAAGQYGGNLLDRQIKLQSLTNARLQAEKTRQEIEQGKPLTGEFASVINGAAGLVAGTKKATVKANIANALSSGNYVTAYAEIANAVEDGLTGTNKTKFADSRTDIGVMTGMRSAIQDFVAAGGNTGILKGTADQIARNFGQLATDPKFAALATQLTREFQTYRLNMTGAAFSPEESREYASVNPSGNKSIDLNLAVIDGALNQLTNRVTQTISQRLPGSQKIYDLAFTKEDVSQNQTPVGDVQMVGSVKYIKAQDGLYYPENQVKQSTTQSTTPSYQSLNTTNTFSNFGSLFNFK